MTHPSLKTTLLGGVAATAALLSGHANAILTLTPAGTALNFSLSTFASGFLGNAGTAGPTGIAVNGLGQVIVDSTGDRKNFVFADVDGQTRATALSSTAFAAFPPAFANTGGLGGKVYGSGGYNNSNFIQFNNDGTVNQTIAVASPGPNLGMWTNPVNGHIFATGYTFGRSYFFELDPATNSFRRFGNPGVSDGITVSADGTKIYTNNGGIYSTVDGSSLGSWGAVAGADGIGIITSQDSLNGDLVVNSNLGTLTLVDVHNANSKTVIASGGSRGDYVASDFTNGTLFVTQSDSVMRLACGAQCAIGAPLPPYPEPATLALFCAGIGGLWAARRVKEQRKRRARAPASGWPTQSPTNPTMEW